MEENKIETFGGKIVQTTVYLSDYEIERLRQGFDVPDEFDDNTSDQDIETYENEEENIGHKEGQVD